jgi:antitoxin VapB
MCGVLNPKIHPSSLRPPALLYTLMPSHPTPRAPTMALQIANPEVVGKIERLAALIGRTELDTIESAIDRFLENVQSKQPQPQTTNSRMLAILARVDSLPDLPNPVNPLCWDPQGLPK